MIKTSLRLLLALTLLLLIALGALLGSERGSRWLLAQADAQLDALSLDGVSGRLFDHWRIERLVYDDGQTRAVAEQLEMRWRLSCLWQRAFCLERARLDSLELTLAPSPDPAETTPAAAPFAIPAPPIALQLDEIGIGRLTLHSGDASHTLEDIALRAAADADAIELHSASLRWRDNRAELRAALAIAPDYPLDAELQLDMPQLLGPSGTALALRASGALQQALQLEAKLSGHQRAGLQGTLRALDSPQSLALTLTGEQLQTLESPTAALRLHDLHLHADGDLERLALRLETALDSAAAGPAQLVATAQLHDTAALKALTLELAALGGTAQLQGSLGWREGLDWQLEGDFSGLDIAHLRDDLSGQLTGEIRSRGQQRDGAFVSPETSLTLDGTLLDRPLRAALDLALDKGPAIALERLQLDNGANRVEASGRIDGALDLRAQIRAPQLDTLWPGLAGALHGQLRASGPLQHPNLELDLRGEALRYADAALARLALKGSIDDGARAASELTLQASGASIAGVQEAQLEARVAGTLDAHRAALSARTPEQSAELALGGALAGMHWRGELQQAALAHGTHQLQLAEPAALAFRQDTATASVAAHCWRQGDARLCLDEDTELSAERGSAALSLRQFELQQLAELLPETASLKGTLEAELRGAWRDDEAPSAELTTRVRGLALAATEAAGAPVSIDFERAEASARLDPVQGQLELQLDAREQGSTKVQASFDPGSKALAGTLALRGFQLEPWRPLLPMLDTLRGELSADGELSGTLQAPAFKGRVALRDPALEGAQVPLSVRGGELALDIDGRRATLDARFDTHPGGQLQIRGQGSVEDAPRATLELVGRELALALPPSIDATLNHDLRVDLGPEQLALRGELHIPAATLVLEGLSGGGPSVSRDMVLVDEEDQEDAAADGASPLQIDMDVRARIDDAVHLSGYGLDTRLRGDVTVRQRPGQPPQLAGELALVEGQYQAYGQDLQVRRGELLFVGPLRSTRVDVAAVRVVDEVEAGLELSGPLLAPQTSLFSEPAMSDADVLSYIVLGGPPGGGGDESAMLARAALGLGLKNGTRIAGQLASAAGIEDFNIGADGRGEDTAVVLSGRLSPKLLLSYRMGVFDTVNTLSARYDLSQALYLELMRGMEQAIDLFYTVDY